MISRNLCEFHALSYNCETRADRHILDSASWGRALPIIALRVSLESEQPLA